MDDVRTSNPWNKDKLTRLRGFVVGKRDFAILAIYKYLISNARGAGNSVKKGCSDDQLSLTRIPSDARL